MNAWEAAGLTAEEWPRHALDIRIRLAAAPYLGGDWGYDIAEPAALWDLPDAMRAGRIVRRSTVTNCSTLTISILTSVFPGAPWTDREYGDLQVYADRLPDNPDAPIQAATRMEIGLPVDWPVPGRWHLFQGWRRFDPDTPRYSGHAFLVLADALGEVDQVLEATSISGIGPRYKRCSLADLREDYSKGLHMAVLSEA